MCVFFFFSFFSPFGRGEWIGGHPSHLCKLFLAKKDESRRMLKGLLFVQPVKHSAGQIFFSLKVVDILVLKGIVDLGFKVLMLAWLIFNILMAREARRWIDLVLHWYI